MVEERSHPRVAPAWREADLHSDRPSAASFRVQCFQDGLLKGEDVPVKVNDHSLDSLRFGIKTAKGMWGPRLRRAA